MGLPERCGEAIDIADLRQGMDGRSQIEFHNCVAFVGEKASHDEDARFVDAAIAQLDALVHGTHRQPSCAFGTKHASDLECAMSVRIRLDHAGDFHMGAHHRTHIAKVARDLLAGNEDVRSERSGHCLNCKGGSDR